MTERDKFYEKCVKEIILNKNASILICGGGMLDKQVFETLGFTDVTISNLDTRTGINEFEPYNWALADMQNLPFDDRSFDYVVVHAAIHHAQSPHRVITEMYRVCRKGLLAFESRDSILMRMMEKFGLTQTYEHAAVYYNDCKFGGVNNTEIPNYIYRWTEREIEKTINSYAPYHKHNIIYKYGTAFPSTVSLEKKGKMKVYVLKTVKYVFFLFTKIFRKQQNQFAFFIEKPHNINLFSWLIADGEQIKFDKKWAEKRYKPNAIIK